MQLHSRATCSHRRICNNSSRRRPWWFTLVLSLFMANPEEGRGVAAAYYYGNYNSRYSNNQPQQKLPICPTPMSLCDNSVVQVSSLDWYCNSPYAYYWGSSAHRNAKVCAYSDKVTFNVTIRVSDTIYDVDDIFVSIAVQYSGSLNILKSKSPSYLCRNYVGMDCTKMGEYTFSFTIRLGSSSSSNSYSNDDGTYSSSSSSSPSTSKDDFCPVLIMAFSSQADSGYNLGALNIECQAWDNSFATWAQSQQVLTPRDWIRDYGIILGTSVVLMLFSLFVWQQARRVTTFASCVEPCMVELDQYYSAYPPPPSDSLQVPSNISNIGGDASLNVSNHASSLPIFDIVVGPSSRSVSIPPLMSYPSHSNPPPTFSPPRTFSSATTPQSPTSQVGRKTATDQDD